MRERPTVCCKIFLGYAPGQFVLSVGAFFLVCTTFWRNGKEAFRHARLLSQSVFGCSAPLFLLLLIPLWKSIRWHLSGIKSLKRKRIYKGMGLAGMLERQDTKLVNRALLFSLVRVPVTLQKIMQAHCLFYRGRQDIFSYFCTWIKN